VSSAEASGVRPVVRTRTCEYHVREDGIIVQTVVAHSGKLTVDDARANTRLFEQFADGARRRLLIDMTVPYTAEPGVREYLASEQASCSIAAVAMVSPSVATRVIGNLSLKLARSSHPCRMFGNIDRAAAWLLRQPADR